MTIDRDLLQALVSALVEIDLTDEELGRLVAIAVELVRYPAVAERWGVVLTERTAPPSAPRFGSWITPDHPHHGPNHLCSFIPEGGAICARPRGEHADPWRGRRAPAKWPRLTDSQRRTLAALHRGGPGGLLVDDVIALQLLGLVTPAGNDATPAGAAWLLENE
jgi:hypothetical protein